MVSREYILGNAFDGDGVVSREGGEFFEVLGRGEDGDCLACISKGWEKKEVSLTVLWFDWEKGFIIRF